MAAAGTVGDPTCSLSVYGTVNPADVPVGVTIGVGLADGYTCLIW